ncbi:MAG: PilZ domain-containing protein [Myxococcales bacterium]|nr:PilZ domain-containing protein [Myxococcales bacterium]
MERRVSPRSKTCTPIAVSKGKTRYLARCVEVSQTGLLAIVPKKFRDCAFEYLSARLMLDTGIVTVLLRRVRLQNELVAYRIVDIDDASQNLLTEFLFDQLHSALPKPTRRSIAPKTAAA